MRSPRSRLEWLATLFPPAIPTLWCPLITHYTDDGDIDAARIAAHMEHLSPCVKGFLIPGSTGDGWEMSEAEIQKLIGVAVKQVTRLKLHLLIGVLKTDAAAARETIITALDWFASRPPETDRADSPICGFTVCPPKGKDLSQAQIHAALASILELNVPTALYQLPQVTQNEMSPETVAQLAHDYPNFILFKDTSGKDHVICSKNGPRDVFMVRGAEGDYARWLKAGGGPYDGFLLSTANCFGRELHAIIELLKAGRRDEAVKLSERLSSVVKEVFGLVAGLPDGNAFANANKAMDHFFAHGPDASRAAPPRLHAGSRLPDAVINKVGQALSAHQFLPERGYLD